MSSFTVRHTAASGRLGQFIFQSPLCCVKTPYLFPVVSCMTGTTARGGGIWRYILQAQKQHSLMRRNIPTLAQTLHFLDYGVSPKMVKERWRHQSIRGMYNSDDKLDALNYAAPLFLDSGGFQLMWKDGLNLDQYAIDLSPSKEAVSIANLQIDLGANIIASLDYPIPPKLSRDEAKQRMKRSRENAIATANHIRQIENPPFLYMPVHGFDATAITEYVEMLFQTLEHHSLLDENFGLAIGSLVPLRGSIKKGYQIIKIAAAAVRAIPIEYEGRIPVHVFGLGGLLIPFLHHFGIDTFDSSTYVKAAIALNYVDPDTLSNLSIMEMKPSDIHCGCRICRELDLRKTQKALTIDSKGKPLDEIEFGGVYKSKFYADLALHNLEVDFDIVERTRQAVIAGSLCEYLIELARKYDRLKYILKASTEIDQNLKKMASRSLHAVTDRLQVPALEQPVRHITLTHRPDDFDITANGYQPQISAEQRILLLLPCTAEKPYSDSYTHKYVDQKLKDVFPNWTDVVHKVSLSGLYGPVPVECETEPPVLDYEFRLQTRNRAQTNLLTERLLEFLQRHGEHYRYYVAYATSKAYRNVFLQAATAFPDLVVLPERLKSQKITQFFRSDNIVQLIDFIQNATIDF